jgi:hypothetical protein
MLDIEVIEVRGYRPVRRVRDRTVVNDPESARGTVIFSIQRTKWKTTTR